MAEVVVRNRGQAPVGLALHEKAEDGSSRRHTEHPVVVLHPGRDNMVDEAFIDAWLDQNANSHLVTQGTIQKCPPPPE